MDKNLLYLALYEISMSIGNTYDLKSMLNESITRILSKLNCSAASVYQKKSDSCEVLYAKPKVLVKNDRYVEIIEALETKFFAQGHHILEEEVDGKYFYLFELKNFGYFALTKIGDPLDPFMVNSLVNINLKLLNAIQVCLEHNQLQEYKMRLSEAQNIASLGSWSTSFSTKKHLWDDELFRILGEEPQSFEPSYKRLLHYVTDKSKAEITNVISEVLRGNKTHYKGELEIIRKNGTIALVEVQSKLVYDDKRKAIALLGTAQDISRQHQLEEQLRAESTLLKTIINSVPLRIYWKDKDSKYLGGNKLFTQDANLENEDDLIGLSDEDMPWKHRAVAYRSEDKDVLESGNAKLEYEEKHTLPDGTSLWLSVSKVPLINEDEKIAGTLGIYHDITSKKQSEVILKSHRDALEYQANHDVLTGLPNRLLFIDRLHQSLYKAHRNSSRLAVLFLDMDRFKEINDSLGHVYGDEAIKEVAKRIESQVRKSDTVARFGGDEFVMILNEISSPMAIVKIVQKLMKSMREPIFIDTQALYVTLSIGISVYPEDSTSADSLLKNADAAMYKAKDSGRNTYVFYTQEMTERAFARVTLESNLREAIENEDFTLYYQPKINTLINRLIGMEVLLRWEHKKSGFISPDKFIPIAEETGLIIPLGKWILEQSMIQIVNWYKKGMNIGRLSINLSMIQLQEDDFLDTLVAMLSKTNCKPEWIEVEVTEGQVMKNPDQTILTLEKISNLGIKIAIDDFGTGYSSLSYLKRLPIDILKIDRSFIKDLPYDEEDVAISKGIIALAKSLNIEVIAEGVETDEQKIFLLDHDCTYVQGYLYSKPLPVEQMEKYVNDFLKLPSLTNIYDI